MEKLLFSRNSVKPSTPQVGTYEGQNLFALLGDSLSKESVNATITNASSSDGTTTHGIIVNRNSKGDFIGFTEFNPFSYRKQISQTDTSGSNADVIWTLPDVTKKSFTLGVGEKASENGDCWFCPNQYPTTSLVKYIKVTNNDSNPVTYRINALAYKNDCSPTASNLNWKESFVTTGTLPSKVVAPMVNSSGGSISFKTSEALDSTQKSSTIEIELPQTYALSSLEVQRAVTSVGGMVYVKPGYKSDFEKALNNSNQYSSSSVSSSVQKLNIDFSSYGDIKYPASSALPYTYRVMKSYKGTSYAQHADETGNLSNELTLYSSPVSSHALVYVEDANPSKTGCTKVDGNNYNRVEISLKGESQSFDIFAYEGEEWFDFPNQEWRKGNSVWACLVEYDSSGKVISVGEVYDIFEHPLLKVIPKVVGNIIQSGIKSGHNRNKKAYSSITSYPELERGNLVKDSSIYKPSYYSSLKYNNFPTFKTQEISTGNKIHKNHVQQMMAIAEDLRGGTSCDSCSGNCYNSCDNSCVSTCDTICKESCGLNCQTVCSSDCGQGCTSVCSSECKSSCGNSCSNSCKDGCTASCYENCSVSCGSSCDSACNGCSNTCYGCTSNCYGNCSVSCGSACDSACHSNCSGGCYNGCGSTCSGGCGRCGGNCYTECAGSSQGCGWWGCSGSCGNGSCSEGCYGGCSGGAGGSCGCGNNCSGGCVNSCSSCTVGCSGGCVSCSNTCLSNCTNGCNNTCSSCSASCSGGCVNCTGGCNNSCNSTCATTCSTTCYSTCSSACVSNCTGGCVACSYSCSASCSNDCAGNCISSCGAGCSDFCSNSCSLSSTSSPIM